MINLIYQLIRTARPRQWLKNFSVFAAPIFTGLLFTGDTLVKTVDAFIAFCFLSSAVYFFNDIRDAEKDRQHPIKKNRPIASGKLSPTLAGTVTIILLLVGFGYSTFFVGTYFSLAVALYVLIQVAYSLYFRNVIILESLFVASGFIIRVFAGGLAAESSVSSWLILTTIGLALLLAFGKRRSERTILLKKLNLQNNAQIETRKALRHYPDSLLDSMITMSATFCILSYSLFTFQTSPQNVYPTLYNVLPSILRSPKWMMLTIPLVIYGVARYLYVIYEKEEGESPERVLLSDRELLYTVILWGFSIMLIIYGLPLVFDVID